MGNMYTLVLINLANQLAHTLDEPSRSNSAKIFFFFIFSLGKSEALCKTKRLQTFAIAAKSQNTGKGIAISFSISDALSFLTSLFKVLLIPNDDVLRNCRCFFQSFLLIGFEELVFKLEEKLSPFLLRLLLYSPCSAPQS